MLPKMITIPAQVPSRGLYLAFCNHRAAKAACVRWHYSGTMPVSKTVKIGVREDGSFIGVLVFSSGSAGVGLFGPSLGMHCKLVCEHGRDVWIPFSRRVFRRTVLLKYPPGSL